MNVNEQFTDWLGGLLWYWRDSPISSEELAEKIMDFFAGHQKHAAQLSEHPLPDSQVLLREMEMPLGRTENL